MCPSWFLGVQLFCLSIYHPAQGVLFIGTHLMVRSEYDFCFWWLNKHIIDAWICLDAICPNLFRIIYHWYMRRSHPINQPWLGMVSFIGVTTWSINIPMSFPINTRYYPYQTNKWWLVGMIIMIIIRAKKWSFYLLMTEYFSWDHYRALAIHSFHHVSLGLPHYPSAQLSSAGQSLPLLRGGLRGVAASDGTGDQSDLWAVAAMASRGRVTKG